MKLSVLELSKDTNCSENDATIVYIKEISCFDHNKYKGW